MADQPLAGRVAAVTGASSGIGAASARALAADGHRLALLARRGDRVQALADELGNGAIAIEADVTDRDSIVAAAQRVQDELGGADILVNNAGGDLVNISSVAGRTTGPGSSVYNATKWGLNGWSEALRQELQPDVRVMIIEPGAVATELTDHITHASAKQSADQLYDELAITAEDIAEVIAFAVGRPQRVTLNEILIRPTAQSL